MKHVMMYGVAALLAGFVASAVMAQEENACEKGKFFINKFTDADANGDGMISKEEHLARAEKKFSEMDKNSDGAVNAEESEAYWAAQKEEWRKGREERREACKKAADKPVQ